VAGGDESPDAESPSIGRSIVSSLDGESLADDLQYKSAHFSNSFHSVLTLAAEWWFRHLFRYYNCSLTEIGESAGKLVLLWCYSGRSLDTVAAVV
jgi:hypothetical protein